MLSDKVRVEFSDELGVTLEIGFGSPDHSRSVKLTPGEARELCDAISGVKEDDAEWTLANAEAELTNAVYRATAIFERLERDGKVFGNGHHIRQKISQKAVAELYYQWNEEGKSVCRDGLSSLIASMDSIGFGALVQRTVAESAFKGKFEEKTDAE